MGLLKDLGILNAPSIIEKGIKPGKPYSQQMGRKAGKGAGKIVDGISKKVLSAAKSIIKIGEIAHLCKNGELTLEEIPETIDDTLDNLYEESLPSELKNKLKKAEKLIIKEQHYFDQNVNPKLVKNVRKILHNTNNYLRELSRLQAESHRKD